MASPSLEQRREEQRASVRRAVLDATESLLLEAGYEGFSIRRLVERCGYTAPTIYHHFGDKPGLLDALLEERFQSLYERVQSIPKSDPPEARLRAMAFAFAEFALRHPTHYQLLALPREPERSPPPSLEESRAEFQRPFDELWDQGRLRAGCVESASQGLWSLIHGIFSLRTSLPNEDWSPTLTEDAVDALLRGMVAPPPAESPRSRHGTEG